MKIKLFHLALLTSIAVMGFIKLPAQTADEIIKKWTDAMGGKDKLGSIKTIYTEGDLNVMNNPAPHKTYMINGKSYKSVTDFNGQIIIDCYGMDSGWSVNPFAGATTPVNMSAAQVKLGQLELDGPGSLFDYATKGSKVEFLGKENLNGATCYKLKLTTATGVEATFFIDSTTNYISKLVKKLTVDGQDIEVTAVMTNYKKTDEGFTMPFSQEITLPGLSLTIDNKKIEINKEIDPTIFEKPKS
jgi:hypothetical protein